MPGLAPDGIENRSTSLQINASFPRDAPKIAQAGRVAGRRGGLQESSVEELDGGVRCVPYYAVTRPGSGRDWQACCVHIATP